MKDMQLRKEMLKYVRKLTDSGWLVGTSGNMSVRTDDGAILITPSSIDYQEMKPEDIFRIEKDGTLTPGTGKPTSSLPFHKLVLEKRPDVNVVLHTHAPYATAASTVTKSVPAMTYPVLIYLGGALPVSDFAGNGTQKEAENIVKAFGQKSKGMLMENHGAVAIGKTLEEAWMNMAHLEENCQVWILAKSTGIEPKTIG